MQYFQADPDCIIFGEVSSLVSKTVGLVAVLTNALRPLSQQICRAFIFGSIAQTTETNQSDLDVMIVGDVSTRDVVDSLLAAQDRLGREINPSVLSLTEYNNRISKGDGFLRRVLSQPRIDIIGGDHDAT